MKKDENEKEEKEEEGEGDHLGNIKNENSLEEVKIVNK